MQIFETGSTNSAATASLFSSWKMHAYCGGRGKRTLRGAAAHLGVLDNSVETQLQMVAGVLQQQHCGQVTRRARCERIHHNGSSQRLQRHWVWPSQPGLGEVCLLPEPACAHACWSLAMHTCAPVGADCMPKPEQGVH